MKAQLCKCNNCEAILVDENPQVGAPVLEVPKGVLYMVKVNIDDEGMYWACPRCQTDAYLTDITNLNQIKQ